MQRSTLAAVAVAIALVACGGTRSATPPLPDDITLVRGVAAEAPATSAGDTAAAADAMTALGVDLYHQLREGEEGNLLISPYSLSTALTMTYAGARGATATEMADVLHLPDDIDVHAAMGALDRELDTRGNDKLDLVTVNQTWAQDGMHLEQDYLDLLATDYGAGMALLDFGGDPEGSRITINDWVAEATRDAIEELFPVGSIDGTTRFVLTNAVYLDAAWAEPFHRAGDMTFRTPEGEVKVPAMAFDEYLPLGSGDGWTAIELPYSGDELAMTLVMPDSWRSFEQRLDAALIDEAIGSVEDSGIHLTMPKFEFKYSAEMNEALVTLGMGRAFGGGADFSGITGEPVLFIDNVQHATWIQVDERGTKAAAATGVAMALSHGPTVNVNRPFLFVIHDRATGAVLFLGRVLDPTATGK